MTYVPDPKKLQKLGFERQPDRDGMGRIDYKLGRMQISTFVDWDKVNMVEHQGLNPNPWLNLQIELPSEEFFDQLLIAIGWVIPQKP